ncbi:hypothetical protein SISNIDRAFT_490531 [Sistotremastrum niveocremeum HHB9708]|uniref:Uncharacterized protein n=1 Tax=Sistotremastrum niveocremeum HHB9708 TaxID=1314777 RepID=A0A164NT68_9AGAM|nr:hypothetical protein SISNIDRAFT_490531 [Sistotremastrum niveocremeum HHB9708]
MDSDLEQLDLFAETVGLSVKYSQRASPELTLTLLSTLFNEISRHLSFSEYMALSRLCRELRPLGTGQLSHSLSVFLTQYMDDPAGFRNQMRMSNCVISGSAVLSILTRDSWWEPSNLDVLCPSESLRQMRTYLRDVEGYVPARYHSPGEEEADRQKGVHAFVRQRKGKPHKFIDLIVPTKKRSINSFEDHPHTAVMNFISADHLVMLYPRLTLPRETFVVKDPRIEVRSKWLSRRYTIKTVRSDATCQGGACPHVSRFVGDSSCLVLPFGDHYDLPDAYLSSANTPIKLGYTRCLVWKCPRADHRPRA